MHSDQITVTVGQVHDLIADQLPSLVDLEILPVQGAGTVNSIFRIGERVAARFPLRADDPSRVLTRLGGEMEASAEFLRACTVPAPEPLHIGRPGHGYPLPWSVQSWVHGTPATSAGLADSDGLALELAAVLHQLRSWDTRGRPFDGESRGGPLGNHDIWVHECISRSEGHLDTDALRHLWSGFRTLPKEGPDLMCHSDLIPSNLLVADGHLVGLLDTGGFQPADQPIPCAPAAYRPPQRRCGSFRPWHFESAYSSIPRRPPWRNSARLR